MEKNNEFINVKKFILNLKPIAAEDYKKIDLDRLVVYALFLLEGKNIPLYFDFISVALFKLFPQKFSLENFKQYPDVFRVNNAIRRTTGALSDKNKKRWANGSPEHGFSLTDFGREIAKQVASLIKNPELQKDREKTNVKTRGRSALNDVQEIRNSDAFKMWRNSSDVNTYEFFAFLKATPYTPKQLLIDHIKQLKNSSIAEKDKETLSFLSWLEKNFKNLL